MAKQFPTSEHRALAYVAMKELGRMLDQDGDLPPGFEMDCSGKRCTVTIPNGVTVKRGQGMDDNPGKQEKSAMQNTYGYAVLFLLFERLQRFNQHGLVMRELTEVVAEVTADRTVTTETALRERNADLYAEFEEWKTALRNRLGMRQENTPRQIVREGKETATVTMLNQLQATV